MVRRRIDKDRIERADRESKLAIEAERAARDAKTARLREARLSAEAFVQNAILVKGDRARAKKKF
ncbi:hypothetical protein [Mesorhizobium carmichaelinearum]|uniref:hypothetical protein n=1 Tax=Mesorhizobium carmichaelinearum TaxID=1208188 RepID=UPI000BA3B5F8|nr:hypothetical protein [Mesorhizobium carmichaelinearum]